jgi:hypothetical protein
MKKIFITLLASVTIAGIAVGQKFSASLTNSGNVLTFKLRPDATTTTGFSTIEFFVRYPNPSAAFTYGTVSVNTADFPGMAGNGNLGGGAAGSGAWEIERDNPAYTLPGYHVDHFIFTAPAVATTSSSYNGGTAYNLISVSLDGVPPNTVDFQFVSDDFESTYYLAITDQNGGDLRPASIANYFFPATLSTAGPNGSTIYYQELLNVPLPVKFLNFTATKNNNSAILNWAVENEDANTTNYEIERSLNGVDFSSLKSIPALNNGRTGNTYTFTQDNLSTIRSSGVIYFRVKQIDVDGRFVYTPIKSVRLDTKGLIVGVYPNPIKSQANVTFDLAENMDVLITINDASGKQVFVSQVQAFKGGNINRVDMGKYAVGTYMLKVQAGTEVKSMPIVKVQD